MPAVLLIAHQDWHCPACGLDEQVRPPVPNRFHICPALQYLTAPMVLAGTDCKLVAHVREDWLGREIQESGEDGRPYMSIETVHADGHTDLAVFAPVARASLHLDD